MPLFFTRIAIYGVLESVRQPLRGFLSLVLRTSVVTLTGCLFFVLLACLHDRVDITVLLPRCFFLQIYSQEGRGEIVLPFITNECCLCKLLIPFYLTALWNTFLPLRMTI